MKVNWNDKYTTISVYSFIVICCSIIFFRILSETGSFINKLTEIIGILQPFTIGFVIAYLLNFILIFIENNMDKIDSLKNLKHSSKRGISIVLTYIFAIFMIYVFIQFVLPQLIDSVSGLVNDIPTYVNNASNLLNDIIKNTDLDSEYLDLALTKWNEFVNYVIKIATNFLPVLGNTVMTVAASIWNIVIGLIVSIYLLIDKEKFCALSKKITYAIFNREHAEIAVELAHRTNDTFGKFLSGKILDSAIIGVLTFLLLTIFNMPYKLLISVIIGITNIIPFFGPFFGAIPSAIIILFVDPGKVLWFLLLIFIIQQLDGNIIGPKILGDSIGISAFWILFSLLVTGKFLGIVGMIIGVPLFAIIYSIIKDIIEIKLSRKGLPVETDNYKSNL